MRNTQENAMETFERYESNVRSYIRSFPTIFEKGRGCWLYDREGREYLDFFAGAGVLNYGHNEPRMKEALIEYVRGDGIAHSLDMASGSKERFLQCFHDRILAPRGLGDYKVQFPGPTGTNAVEAALKLARKVSGRETIVSFTNAFHGMTLGALAVTGSAFKRAGAGIPLAHASAMPYDGYFGEDVDTIEYARRLIEDQSSGLDLPAAIVVETIQAEGGINVASFEWLRGLQALACEHDILLVVDDIQVGNGRTGPYFSFERAGIEPDIITLSKSLSGFGQPLSITLFRSDLDVWDPGEHNGTFRGNNLAFVTSVVALESYWSDTSLTEHVDELGETTRSWLEKLALSHPQLRPRVRGRGLIHGIDFPEPGVAKRVCRAAFERQLLVESSGPESNVVKVMPPLTVSRDELEDGLGRLADAVESVARA
jgi:diaminobutyrate-2-oxoglutarate transaminase